MNKKILLLVAVMLGIATVQCSAQKFYKVKKNSKVYEGDSFWS